MRYALDLRPDDIFESDVQKPVHPMNLGWLVQKAKEFETVLANELPGLPTYVVSAKGIYATDDLVLHADMHIPERYGCVLSEKAKIDIQQAGRCLAFEVATASAFHMWRAVESVMDSYYQALTGKSFGEASVGRNWGKYIEALNAAKAANKITSFLNHIREEYRNPISHPEDTFDLDEAFALFGAALSVIVQILKAVVEIKDSSGAPALTGLMGLRALTADRIPPKADTGSI